MSDPYCGLLSDDETHSQTSQVSCTSKITPKPKRRGKSKKDANFETAITDLLRQQSEEDQKLTKLMLEKSDEDHFFESCRLRMKKLSRKEKGSLQIKIMQLLYEAECADELGDSLPNIVSPKRGRVSAASTISIAGSDLEPMRKQSKTHASVSATAHTSTPATPVNQEVNSSRQNISPTMVLTQAPAKDLDINRNITNSQCVMDQNVPSQPAFTTIDGTTVMLDGSTAYAYLLASCSDGQKSNEQNPSTQNNDILEMAMQEIIQ